MFEEFLGLASFEVAVQQLLSGLVNHAGVHFVGVQVDSAVEWVLSLIKIHSATADLRLFSLGGGLQFELTSRAGDIIYLPERIPLSSVMDRLPHSRRP